MGPIRHVKKVVMISALLLRPHPVARAAALRARAMTPRPPTRTSGSSPRCSPSSRASTSTRCPPKDVIYSAIKGTLRGLDPHSSFLDPEMYREMQVETSGSFGGLGIEITLQDDVLTVVAPIEGTPAYRAGIQLGRPHRQDRGPVDQGHAAHRRGQAHARQAREQGDDQHRARGLGGAEGLRRSSASRSACSR